MKLGVTLSLTIFLLASCSTNSPTSPPPATAIPNLTGEYLGLKLPGAQPVSFSTGAITGGYHSSPTFLPDGSEMYWGTEYSKAKIFTIHRTGDTWGNQEELVLSEKMSRCRDPFVSADGNWMYFLSQDALPGEAFTGKENIWMTERSGNGWLEPEPLPEIINTLSIHWTVSVSSNRNLYFSSGPGGIEDIFLSRFVDGQYTLPEKLDFPVNTGDQIETTPNIAPDESYILFSRMPDNNSTPRLFVSYATSDGWSEAKMVENVANCISPMVTPDREFIFCLSGPSLLVWRDTTFLQELQD